MLYEKMEAATKFKGKTPLSLYMVAETQNPDILLWQAFKQGDTGAFKKIYTTYAEDLYDQGCRYTNDKELVRDCLHDFFIYLNKNRKGFGETNSIKPYLLKSFRRRVIDYVQKRKCEYNVEDANEYFAQYFEISSEAAYITLEMNLENQKRLNEAIKLLDSKEQKVIYCFYFKGMRYDQIAKMLNFTHVSSARRVLYRSLQQLRHHFVVS